MKPRALKFSFCAALCLALAVGGPSQLRAADPEPNTAEPPAQAADASPAVVDTPPPLGTDTPAPQPAATAKPLKPGKKAKPAGTPKVRAPKEFPFPLPIHEDANNARIPELNQLGNILSVINSAKMTRIDNEHVLMHEVRYDLNKPDGKQDFHITIPTSVFDLKTHVITSDEPVTVKADDFELTGERMEFNTVDRTGKLLGHVTMHIHNLKQVAAGPDATPAPSP
jgi:hypothetical protein